MSNFGRNFNNYYKTKFWTILTVITSDPPLIEVRTLSLSHKDRKIMFIILYKHYVLEISELKNPTAKVKIWNLTNYSAVCCPIHLGATVVVYNLLQYQFPFNGWGWGKKKTQSLDVRNTCAGPHIEHGWTCSCYARQLA